MEEDERPAPPGAEGISDGTPEEDRGQLRRQLKENERRWAQEGDSETLWEREHDLLIRLQRIGDASSLGKRARGTKGAMTSRGSARDLAEASLGLWVLERFDEAEPVLRTAIQRLPGNRYPWSLMLRHLSWEREPREAMDFILSSLDRVPWRAYALVQLGTILVGAASKGLAEGDLEACGDHLGAARGYMEEALAPEGCTDDLRKQAERLIYLVDTMELRLEKARGHVLETPPEGVTLEDGFTRLERGMRKVAEASGVSLAGESDEDLDLEELERAAFLDMPDEDGEESFTVLEVTPTKGLDLLRRRRREEKEEREEEEE